MHYYFFISSSVDLMMSKYVCTYLENEKAEVNVNDKKIIDSCLLL